MFSYAFESACKTEKFRQGFMFIDSEISPNLLLTVDLSLFLTETVLRTYDIGDFTQGGVVKCFRARKRALTIYYRPHLVFIPSYATVQSHGCVVGWVATVMCCCSYIQYYQRRVHFHALLIAFFTMHHQNKRTVKNSFSDFYP